MNPNEREKYHKLLKMMQSQGVPMTNPQHKVDLPSLESEDKARQLQLIDDKLSELQDSDDPNSLESLAFWQKRRAQLAGD